MKQLAFLAILTFCTISALVSVRTEWFGFIYDIPGGDKSFHFIGAGLLSFFMVLGLSPRPQRGRTFSGMATLAGAALLVTVEELVQGAIPSRIFSLEDLTWSLTGMVIFGLAALGIAHWRRGEQNAKFGNNAASPDDL